MGVLFGRRGIGRYVCMYVWKTFESLLLVMGEERLTFDDRFVFRLAPMSQSSFLSPC